MECYAHSRLIGAHGMAAAKISRSMMQKDSACGLSANYTGTLMHLPNSVGNTKQNFGWKLSLNMLWMQNKILI